MLRTILRKKSCQQCCPMPGLTWCSSWWKRKRAAGEKEWLHTFTTLLLANHNDDINPVYAPTLFYSLPKTHQIYLKKSEKKEILRTFATHILYVRDVG